MNQQQLTLDLCLLLKFRAKQKEQKGERVSMQEQTKETDLERSDLCDRSRFLVSRFSSFADMKFLAKSLVKAENKLQAGCSSVSMFPSRFC